jgi:hypothetical protein
MINIRTLQDEHKMKAYRTDRARQSVCLTSRTSEWILTKFDVNVKPLENTPISYILISYNW